MASIADAGHSGRARWAVAALLRRLQPAPRTRVAAPEAVAGAVPETVVAATEDRRARRHYPPQRDRLIEQAAMAREMYRL